MQLFRCSVLVVEVVQEVIQEVEMHKWWWRAWVVGPNIINLYRFYLFTRI